MRAPEALVRTAYAHAKTQGARYVLMFFHATETSLEPWDYMLVFTNERLAEEVRVPGGFAQLREIYSVDRQLEEQLGQTIGFAWSTPDSPLFRAAEPD